MALGNGIDTTTNSSIVHKALPTVDLRWFHVQSLCYGTVPSNHSDMVSIAAWQVIYHVLGYKLNTQVN